MRDSNKHQQQRASIVSFPDSVSISILRLNTNRILHSCLHNTDNAYAVQNVLASAIGSLLGIVFQTELCSPSFARQQSRRLTLAVPNHFVSHCWEGDHLKFEAKKMKVSLLIPADKDTGKRWW
jgi:hypothetical protein